MGPDEPAHEGEDEAGARPGRQQLAAERVRPAVEVGIGEEEPVIEDEPGSSERAGQGRQRGQRAQPGRYRKSTDEYSESFSSAWRASMRRTVPDFERMTSDEVVAPRAS
jgi:hypothetical protein